MKSRKSLKVLLFWGAATLLLYSCSHSDIKVLSKAKDNNTAPIRAAVISKEKIHVMNTIDVRNYIAGGNENDVYKIFFAENFVKQLQAKGVFQKVSYTSSSPSHALRDTTIKISSRQRITVSLPQSGATLKTDSIDAEILLFIERNASFREDKQNYDDVSFHDATLHTAIESSRLFQEITFILWDNVSGKPISIGRAVAKTGGKKALSKLAWDNGIEELAKEVLKNTGYSKKN